MMPGFVFPSPPLVQGDLMRMSLGQSDLLQLGLKGHFSQRPLGLLVEELPNTCLDISDAPDLSVSLGGARGRGLEEVGVNLQFPDA